MSHYDRERGDPRRTKIIDDFDPPMTNPNGIKDVALSEREARLWLLSQAERAAGVQVDYDVTSERWHRVGEAVVTRCENCSKIFRPSRKTAKFCTATCRKDMARKTGNATLTGRLVSQ